MTKGLHAGTKELSSTVKTEAGAAKGKDKRGNRKSNNKLKDRLSAKEDEITEGE